VVDNERLKRGAPKLVDYQRLTKDYQRLTKVAFLGKIPPKNPYLGYLGYLDYFGYFSISGKICILSREIVKYI
jgi:hypothetical protein